MVKHISEYGSDAVDAVRDKSSGDTNDVPGPSTNPVTNIVITDVAMRTGSYILRAAIEKGMLRGRYGREMASEIVRNKTLGQTLVSVGLSKLATRSLPGALVVGGGMAVKTLFDRSQKRRNAKRSGDATMQEQANRN